jgi:O-antigen/teichoic acid export membrane protein
LKRLRTWTKGDRWLVASNVGARVAAMISLAVATVVVARIGGPTAVGIYALMRVLPGLAGVLISAGLPGAIAYFLAGPRGQDHRLRPSLLAIMLAGGCAGMVVWWAATPLLHRVFFSKLSVELVVLAGVSVFTQLTVATAKSCSQGSDDLPGANRVIFFEEFMFLPAYPLVLLFGAHGLAAMIIALVAADVFTSVPSWWRLARLGFFRGWSTPSADLVKEVAGYGVRGQVGGLMSLLNLRLDFTILGAMAGPAVLGTYAIASKFAELLKVPALAFTYVLYPRFAREEPRRATAAARSMMRRAGPLIALAAVPLGLAAGWIIPHIYGHKFAPGVGQARVLLLGLAGEGLAGVISGYLYGRGRPGLNSLAMGAGVVITIVLDATLIGRYGAMGAAVASTTAYLTSTLVLVLCFRKVAEQSTGGGAGEPVATPLRAMAVGAGS